MKNNHYIYIVLVRAMTGIGKFARKFSKYEYTHIAICMDNNLSDFITFSRKKHYTPFDAGFMHETLDCYAYGKYNKVKLKVFKVPLQKKNKLLIENYINNIANDESYIFNLYSMATMSLFHGFRIYKAYNCMSFVSKILELSNSIKLSKKYYKYNIKDIDVLLSDYKYIEKDFTRTKIENVDYMKSINIFKNIYLFLKLNCQLLYRIITKTHLLKQMEDEYEKM